MGFGEGYLIENYEKCFEEGKKAKERNNLKLAKSKFSEALHYLEKLVAISEGEIKEKRKSRAERLKTIVDSIDENAVPQKQNNVQKPDYTPKGFSLGDNSNAPENNSDTVDNVIPENYDDVSQFVTIFEISKLKNGFEGVVGLEDAKNAVTEYVINPIKYPDAYNYNYMENKAVLLYGPPGTGKTTFAKAVAKETKLPFFLVNMSSIVNCYVGETAKNIDLIFNFMRNYVEKNNTQILVFFDEFDEIAKSRSSGDKTSETAVPALIRNLDGVKENKGFLVLANTNCMESLDSAILSRFRQRILIPLPDQNSREKMFYTNLKELEEEYLNKINLKNCALLSDDLSGRDIAYICDDFKLFLSSSKAHNSVPDDLNAEIEKIIAKRKK